jgi:cytochrome c553
MAKTARVFVRLCIAAAVAAPVCNATASLAQTAAEAYARGCGGCHESELTLLRRLRKVPEAERKAWLERFFAQHPCERDDLKPLILDYLLQRTAR